MGGEGNIRNSNLNCVRYTILAGGSMVIPRIVVEKCKGYREDKNREEDWNGLITCSMWSISWILSSCHVHNCDSVPVCGRGS